MRHSIFHTFNIFYLLLDKILIQYRNYHHSNPRYSFRSKKSQTSATWTDTTNKTPTETSSSFTSKREIRFAEIKFTPDTKGNYPRRAHYNRIEYATECKTKPSNRENDHNESLVRICIGRNINSAQVIFEFGARTFRDCKSKFIMCAVFVCENLKDSNFCDCSTQIIRFEYCCCDFIIIFNYRFCKS